MKTLDEIKQMMAAGDTAQADEALKELLAKEPDNLQAKMLYGTCRQLLGDEETFKRIHDELAPVMERVVKEEPQAATISLWRKYQRMWECLIVAGLIIAGVGTAAWCFGNDLLNMLGVANRAVVGDAIRGLYAGPPRNELEIETPRTSTKKFFVSDEEPNTTK